MVLGLLRNTKCILLALCQFITCDDQWIKTSLDSVICYLKGMGSACLKVKHKMENYDCESDLEHGDLTGIYKT